MSKTFPTRSISLYLSLFFVTLLGTGTKACQEDYELGVQSSLTDTTTTTTSSSSTTDPDDGETTTSSTTSSTTSTTIAGVTTTTLTVNSFSLLKALESLNASGDVTVGSVNSTGKSGGRASNWLGKNYRQDEVPGEALDSDGDGYTDKLETDAGSNPKDTNSIPPPPISKIADRFDGIDDDRDGLKNNEERNRGTDPFNVDSDGDGFQDGVEVLSGSEPRDSGSRPNDLDGDGLSSEYEIDAGFDFQASDTDGDGVNDGVELALGMNPLLNDSDHDGILDRKELELGSDPTIPEGAQ